MKNDAAKQFQGFAMETVTSKRMPAELKGKLERFSDEHKTVDGKRCVVISDDADLSLVLFLADYGFIDYGRYDGEPVYSKVRQDELRVTGRIIKICDNWSWVVV